MKNLTAQEVREIWLKFFASKQHLIIDSSPLVPIDDPTLLWINAGVAPLKKYFDGSEMPPRKRMANVQKCIRTNDIENVGFTARHHTFFEMLGNFSIGDYFKKEAIEWGFELLTSEKYFNLDLNKLYFTYYPTDLDAKQHWLNLGIDESKIIPHEDCFWEIGEGPCGPSTEIHYDRGIQYDERGIELLINDIENDRYVEIWNIVFSQYNSQNGLTREEYPELPNKNIDTGAGLERLVAIFQDVPTNFETDLFLPIIKHVEELSQVKYEGQKEFKIIADHIRTVVIALSDGATISNEGRGYVLRRLLRRALKHGRSLGLNKPFLHMLIDDVVNIMKIQYPAITNYLDIIKRIVLTEEEKFLSTLSLGEKQFYELLDKSRKQISGDEAFKLYDTYGFPIELTVEYAKENQISVDIDGFERQLELQKQRSRDARSNEGSMHSQDEKFLQFMDKSNFVGYDVLETKSKIIKVFKEGIVLDQTSFYAESGGQVADKGSINGFEVIDCQKLPNGQHLHVVDAKFEKGEEVIAKVDQTLRNETIKNHTATHLLHKSLKLILGAHVNQHGSRVSPESLRFDFNNFNFPTQEDILKIEQMVNREIQNSLPVVEKTMSLDEAKKMGAEALFSEKYGDIVRVIDMGFSKELCGGTHVSNTKQIEKLAIVSIESIGSGIYRIEAVSGSDIKNKVKRYLKPLILEIENLKEKISKILISEITFKYQEIPVITGSYQDFLNYHKYLQQLKESLKEYEKTLQVYQERKSIMKLDEIKNTITGSYAVLKIEGFDSNVLKSVLDNMFEEKKLDVLFIANICESKITFIAKSNRQNANKLIQIASQITNGRGGGKGDFARGGGQDVTKLDEALKEVEKIIYE